MEAEALVKCSTQQLEKEACFQERERGRERETGGQENWKHYWNEWKTFFPPLILYGPAATTAKGGVVLWHSVYTDALS